MNSTTTVKEVIITPKDWKRVTDDIDTYETIIPFEGMKDYYNASVDLSDTVDPEDKEQIDFFNMWKHSYKKVIMRTINDGIVIRIKEIINTYIKITRPIPDVHLKIEMITE